MKKRIKFCAVLLIILVFLTGCLDVEEEILINEDGSGAYRIAMVMDSSVPSLMDDGETEPMLSEEDFPGAETKSYIDADGNFVEEAVINFDDLETFVNDFNRNSEDGGIIMEFAAGDGGNVIFRHLIEGSDSESGGALGDGAEFISGEMLEGLEWKLTITAPEIVDTNGNLSEDGTQASWTIPLTMLDSPQGHEAYVEYSTGGLAVNLVMILAAVGCCFGLVLLAAAAAAVFFFVRSRSKTEAEV